MLKKLYVILCFSGLNFAQVGIHGDVYIAANNALAVHTPATHFIDGIIHTDTNTPGSLRFLLDNHAIGTHSDSYVEAQVTSIETAEFVFPVGDAGVYQPLKIAEGSAHNLTVDFKQDAFHDLTTSDAIETISNAFYWTTAGAKQAKITLSWNTYSNLDLLTEELAALVMIGYTGTEWEIIPALLDPFTVDSTAPTTLVEGAISSTDRVDFSRFEAVTLGSILLDTRLVVSEAITPNGDSINDRWFIENINRYPDARIWVYNRWGAEVFHQAGNYSNTWEATYKNNTKKLPAASYYYRIDQDNDGSIDLSGWIYITY